METVGNDEYRVDETMPVKVKNNPLIGRYINCFIGQSTDEDIRKRATSGGIVTTLLIFALKKEIVDGALVTKSCGVKPRVFLAETEDEIRSASGSKYCPVPLVASINLLSEKNGKFAVVGLPCHIRAVRRLEALNKEIKDKIVLHIGLFCSHSITFDGVRFLIENLGIGVEDVLELSYRAKKGQDTGMLIRTKDGCEKFIPLKRYWNRFFMFFFIPFHCLKCHDATAELADISFGDAWLTELRTAGGIEHCIFVSRNSIGDSLVELATGEGLIKCQRVDSGTVIRSQKLFLHLKKRVGMSAFCLLAFLMICSLLSTKLRCFALLKCWIHFFKVMG